MSDEERVKMVADLASQQDWDTGPLTLVHEMKRFLDSVRDEDTGIDSGAGDGMADLHVIVDGAEYYVRVRRSNRQLAIDQGLTWVGGETIFDGHYVNSAGEKIELQKPLGG